MNKKNIYIILNETQMPELIGMAARSILNFDFKNLVIVNPKQTNWQEKAVAPSCGALSQLEITTHRNLDDALKNIHIAVSLSARKRYLNKDTCELSQILPKLKNSYDTTTLNIAFIFGNEKSGLSNDDIAKSNFLAYIDTNEDFSSLNLAQSVALTIYTLHNFIKQQPVLQPDIDPIENYATNEEISYFFNDLFTKLEINNYFSDMKRKNTTINNIKNIYLKNHLTKNEVKTLIGINKLLFGKK